MSNIVNKPNQGRLQQAHLTPKERMIRALKGEKVDMCPVAPAYLSLFLEDFERAYYAEQYNLRMGGRAGYPIQFEEDLELRKQAFYQSYGIFKARPDWMELSQGASRAWAKRTEMIRQGGVLHYQDVHTGVKAAVKEIYIPYGDSPLPEQNASLRDLWDLSTQVQSKDQIDELIPVVKAEDLIQRGDFDLPRRVVADYGEEYFLSTVLDTPFSSAYNYLGFQGLMFFQYDRPDLLHSLLERLLTQSKEVIQAWAITGIHGVYVQEVFTGADVISQRSYDEFVFPYNQSYFEFMSGLGLLPIYYLCGNIIPRLERVCQMKVAAIAAEESKKNFRIDLEEVVRRVGGRLAVFGNIDTIQFGLRASLEQVADEVERQVAIGSRARGFVVSTGSPFPLDTNPRVIDTMVTTAHAINMEALRLDFD